MFLPAACLELVLLYAVYMTVLKLLFGLCFQGSGNLDAIQIIKKLGGNLVDSYLDEGTL